MNNIQRRVLDLFIFSACCSSGLAVFLDPDQSCIALNPSKNPRASGAAIGQSKFAVPTVCKSVEEIEKDQLQAKVRTLFYARKFDDLEKIVQQLRNNKTVCPSGYWKSRYLYEVLCAAKERRDPSFDWNNLFDGLKLWVTKYPMSATPRIAYAKALKNYAWKARGGGWAKTVNEASWKEFDNRLRLAHQSLLDAQKLKTADPELIATLLDGVFLGEGVDKATYDITFNQEIKNYPTFYVNYFSKALYLQPRWHGAEGEWQSFAKDSADKLGGESGDILYARILWSLHELKLTDNILNEPNVDKERVLRGFKFLEKQYPNSLWVLSAECRMAVMANSTEKAALLMSRLGNRVDLSVWKTVDYFNQIKNCLHLVKQPKG